MAANLSRGDADGYAGVGTVVAYGWWVVRTTSRVELLPFSPRASLSMDEVAAAEAAEQQVAREISRVSVKALRKTLRP